MNRFNQETSDIFRDIEVESALVELKEDLYRNSLLLATILELLIEKGIFTERDVQMKAADIDRTAMD